MSNTKRRQLNDTKCRGHIKNESAVIYDGWKTYHEDISARRRRSAFPDAFII